MDPEAARRLHPADEKRILRALEVYRETGKTITEHNRETAALPPRYDAVWIGLQFEERAEMKALIDRRVDAMVEEGTATVDQAVAEVKLRSRQYAKRQLTWLRRNPEIHWIWWGKERDFARALQISTEILSDAGVS